MTEFQRRPSLPNAMRRVSTSLQTQESFNRGKSNVLYFDGPFQCTTNSSGAVTKSWTLVKGQVNTFLKPVIEIYAQGLGTTNGANKYIGMYVYIDGQAIYANTLLSWGTSSAAVTAERRRTIPGSALGSNNRLGGFIVLQLDSSQFPSSDIHDFEVTLEPDGTSANCSVEAVQVVTRIL